MLWQFFAIKIITFFLKNHHSFYWKLSSTFRQNRDFFLHFFDKTISKIVMSDPGLKQGVLLSSKTNTAGKLSEPFPLSDFIRCCIKNIEILDLVCWHRSRKHFGRKSLLISTLDKVIYYIGTFLQGSTKPLFTTKNRVEISWKKFARFFQHAHSISRFLWKKH
jgi:hypothetical protein